LLFKCNKKANLRKELRLSHITLFDVGSISKEKGIEEDCLKMSLFNSKDTQNGKAWIQLAGEAVNVNLIHMSFDVLTHKNDIYL